MKSCGVLATVLCVAGTVAAQDDPIDALFEQLVAAKPAERHLHARRIVRLGKRAVPALIRVLAKESQDAEMESFDDVVGIGGGAGGRFGRLIKRPEYKDPLRVYRTLGTLFETRRYNDYWSKHGLTAESRIKVKNWGRLHLACYCLGEIGPAAAPAIPELSKWLTNEYDRQRQAFWTLAKIGKDSLPTLASHIRNPLARAALAFVGRDAVSMAAERANKAKHHLHRTAWCHAIGRFDAEHAPSLVGALVDGLGSSSGDEAKARMRALWVHSKAARPRLTQALEDRATMARLRALAVLISATADESVRELALRRFENDGERDVRRYAGEFLLREARGERLGVLAPRLAGQLERAYERAGDSMLEQLIVLNLYSALRGPKSQLASFVDKAMAASHWQVRVAAHGAVGPQDAGRATAIAKSIKAEIHYDAKIAKLEAIARMKLRGSAARELCPLLLTQYRDKGLRGGEAAAQISGFVIDALRSFGPDALPALEHLMTVLEKSPVPWLRREATRAIGAIGPAAAQRAMPALKTRFVGAAKYPIAIVEALGRLGEHDALVAKFAAEIDDAGAERLVRLAEFFAVLDLSKIDAKRVGTRLREREGDVAGYPLRARFLQALAFDVDSAPFLVQRYKKEPYWQIEQALLRAFERLGPAAKAAAPEIAKRIAENPMAWNTGRRRAALDAVGKSR